jgi:SAM-dependent methyltransferase
MTMAAANADQIAYWNGMAGQKWATAQERLDAMLSVVSERLMTSAIPQPHEHILDIGCGCGDTTMALAARGATATGIDVSRPMLERARLRAPALSFIEADAATRAFKPEYDAIVSRFGVMFFDNPDAAFRNMRKALKPGGRMVFACWRDSRENEWVRVPVSAVRALLPPQPQLGPEDPGPFSFADLGRVRRILAGAGFDRITAEPFDTELRLGANLDEAVAHVAEIGPVSRMLADASPEQRSVALAALHDALAGHARKSPFSLGGAVWIVSAEAGTP